MNWIQVLLIAAVVALLFYLLRSRSSAKTKAWVKVGYVLFVVAAVYAILRPDDTTVVANWLGVDRGADLIGVRADHRVHLHHDEHLHAIQGSGTAVRAAGARGGAAERARAPERALSCRKYRRSAATPSSRRTCGASPAPARRG